MESVYSHKFQEKKCYFDALPQPLLDIADKPNKMDGLAFLAMFPDNSAPAVIFDPQYRGVLDDLDYGNDESARTKLPQMGEELIIQFIKEIDRVTKPSGHFMIWIDKYHLVSGIQSWFDGTKFHNVDMVTWEKGNIGCGYRTRRKSEFILIYQKEPKRAKGCWVTHDIPDVWKEKVKKVHTHSKPELLQSRLIESVVPIGDFVIDPTAGGFSVMRSALTINRHFLGVDLMYTPQNLENLFTQPTEDTT